MCRRRGGGEAASGEAASRTGRQDPRCKRAGGPRRAGGGAAAPRSRACPPRGRASQSAAGVGRAAQRRVADERRRELEAAERQRASCCCGVCLAQDASGRVCVRGRVAQSDRLAGRGAHGQNVKPTGHVTRNTLFNNSYSLLRLVIG